MSLVMLLLWIRQVTTLNAGTVDVAWAYGTGAVGAWFALAGDGQFTERQYLVAALSLAWGIRLGYYLQRRVGSESEDGRYRYLREYLGSKAQPFYFVFYQVQASWTLLFALPMWAAANGTAVALGLMDGLGFAIWVLAIAGERSADNQLALFRSNPAHKGMVCNVGWWRWSRHPNYFFEWLHWFAYVAIASQSDVWWVAVLGTFVMYVFITHITGVPYTEQQSIRSRGEAYVAYQRSTSKFFPIPPLWRTSS
jgi:steroid 5-alpha reductase family enzyme